MARPQNELATVPTTIATTEMQRRYLAELVKTGLYGKNPADAAERVISAELHRLLKDGTIQFQKAPAKKRGR
jgi:hypothetical protein